MSLCGSSPSDARRAFPGAPRRIRSRMQALGVQDSPRLLRNVQPERDVARLFNQRCSRIICERFRIGKAPIRRMGRPTPWSTTFLDKGLARMELAVCWRQLSPPPSCYCISSPKSKFAPRVVAKQTQRLTETDDLAARVLRRPCPNVAHLRFAR